MDLLEVQAMRLLDAHDVPVSEGELARTPSEARAIAEAYGVPVVVKAQVKVGGRGKAGGVKFAPDPHVAEHFTRELLDKEINEHICKAVLIAKAADIEEEYYLSFLVDRSSRSYVALCSSEGGMEIEELAEKFPEKLARIFIDPYIGIDESLADEIIRQGGLPVEYRAQLIPVIMQLWEVFIQEEATLLEINPLVLTREKKILCLDGKITIDDNALFRTKKLRDIDDSAHTYRLEAWARELHLNYIKLDGQVGVIGNGAGLVMSTLDVIALAGRQFQGITAANFLDIGGGANAETMANALRIVLSDPQVKSVFVNIFGGITACTQVAQGIVQAIEMLNSAEVADSGRDINFADSVDISQIPIVIRMDGNHAEQGLSILADAHNPQIILMRTMDDAAYKAAELAAYS